MKDWNNGRKERRKNDTQKEKTKAGQNSMKRMGRGTGRKELGKGRELPFLVALGAFALVAVASQCARFTLLLLCCSLACCFLCWLFVAYLRKRGYVQ